MIWAPFGLLAVWGVAYLVDCFNALSGPGTGLIYKMEARGGTVTLRTGSYSFDIWSGALIGHDVSITSPTGEQVAVADLVSIRIPDYLKGTRRTLSARIKNLEGTIERDAQGRFSLFDLLPPETDEKSELPFRVDVENAVIHLIDRSGAKPFSETFRIPRALVDGIGEDWRASGQFFQARGGSASVAIHNSPERGFSLNGLLDRTELAHWLEPIRRSKGAEKWALIKEISARSLIATGPISLRLPKQGDVEIDGTLQAAGEDVHYLDVFARTATLYAKFNTGELNGWLDVDAGDSKGKFVGRVAWKPEVEVYGQLNLSMLDPSRMPKKFRNALPSELGFRDAHYSGMVAYDVKGGLALHGDVHAARANWKDQVVERPVLALHLDPRWIAVREFSGVYKEVGVRGSGDFDLKARTINAFAESDSARIEQFREQTGLDRVYGPVIVEALASGSLDKPQIEFRAKGNASAEIERGRVVDLGPFHALAKFDDQIVRIEKLAVSGPAGVAVTAGTYNLETHRIDMQGVATGLDLARLHSKLNGTATGTFKVSGTAEKFIAQGPVEVYGLEIEGQPVPLVAAQIEVTPERLLAKEVHATRGAARLHGEAAWAFKTDALKGHFVAESVQLHDFMEEGYEGSVDISEGLLTGTLTHPVVSGTLSGKDLVVQGVRLDTATGKLRITDTVAELLESRITAEEGTLEATATYNLNTRDGQVSGRAEGLPIDRVQPLLPPDTGLEGKFDGDFEATIVDARLGTFEATGNVEAFTVNRQFLGNGFFTLNEANNVWTGNIEIGQPERFIQVPEFTYRPQDDTLEADIVAYGLPIRDLYFASRPYFTPEPGKAEPRVQLPRNLRDALDRLQGSLDLNAHLSGNVADPSVQIESLALRDTTLDGDPMGRIDAIATRSGELWTIQKFEWKGGPGVLSITGNVTERGPISLDGNVNNFDTQWLARFLPAIGHLTGDANLFFTVTGDSKAPQIEASFTGSLFEASATKVDAAGAKTIDEEKKLHLEIYPILVTEGEITLNGLFGYRGFKGTLEGRIPFRYPFTFPDDEEMRIALHVPKRPLDELKPLLPGLDVNETDGSVWADVVLAGVPGNVELTGNVNVEASSLAFAHVSTVFKDVKANTSLTGEALLLNLAAKPARGGDLTLNARMGLDNFPEAISDAMRSEYEKLLAQRVSGSLVIKDLHIDERHGESGSVEFIGNGGISLSGNLGRPTISTFQPLVLSNVKGTVPTLVLEETAPGDVLVNPNFQIAYVVGSREDPAEVRAAASVLNLYGTGTLKGRLDNLDADANLLVKGGTIRLPNARIVLQEGGTVHLTYDGGIADPEMRLDVDVEGRTSLSTLRFGTIIEHYDIYLQIRGNLMHADEQIITARSDPPDLTQDRILSLLGQIELVETISGEVLGQHNKKQLERALTTLALPTLFDPITEEIARQLGLEYLSLDYGPLGQTNVTAAKSLGSGFMIQGRKEISEPLDGLQDYDLRLTYRPPRRIRELRGLIFSMGLDQERPWKISVEYGARLRNFGTPNKSNVIWIGPEPKNKPPAPVSPPPPKP